MINYTWLLIIVVIVLLFWCLTQSKSGYKNVSRNVDHVCCQYTTPDGNKAYFWWYKEDCQPDDAPPSKRFKIMPNIKTKAQCKARNF